MKNDLFTLEYGKESSDCTCEYIIRLLRECTVREFIWEWFKKYPKEWGYFEIYVPTTRFGRPQCEYKCGKIIGFMLPDVFLDAKLLRVDGSGGWTRSDLVFYI